MNTHTDTSIMHALVSGEFGESGATVKAAVFHWIVSSLSRSEDSLIKQLTSAEEGEICMLMTKYKS